MSLIEVLSKIQRLGGIVRIEAGEVVIAVPPGTLDSDDRQVLVAHKPEILSLFEGSESEPLSIEDVPWWWESGFSPDENRLLGEFIEHDSLDVEGRGTEIVLVSEECEECHKRLGWVNPLGFERCLDCDRPRDLAGLARRLRERSGLPSRQPGQRSWGLLGKRS